MQVDIRAYLALLLYIPVCVAVLGSTPRQRAVEAISTIYLGGLLFLPEKAAFDLPMLPTVDKNVLASLMGLLGAFMLLRDRITAVKPFTGIDRFVFVFALGAVGTAFTNADTLIRGETRFGASGLQIGFEVIQPGYRAYDTVSMIMRDLVEIYLPFLLARAIFRKVKDVESLMKVVVGWCFVYTPLMAWEMRMGPTLHHDIYGYSTAAFAHSVRSGGFKPKVFMQGGLAVAMFFLAGVICSTTLLKRRQTVNGIPSLFSLGTIWGMLGISKNAGAAVYSLAAVPVLMMSRGRLATRAAAMLGILVVLYPAIRWAGIIDVYAVTEWIRGFAADRAFSLEYRFHNEDEMLARATERIWFGWGGYGRNRVYNEFGVSTSVTDGEWIIRVGAAGIVGFIGVFGLLISPVFFAGRVTAKMANRSDRRVIDALSLLAALNAVDLLPNGMFTQMPYFFAGALTGVCQGVLLDLRSRGS